MCHVIFDVNMGENFRSKYQFVAYGDKTQTLAAMTYSYVVSRDSVLIAMTFTSLNYIFILSCNIHNACLTEDYI